MFVEKGTVIPSEVVYYRDDVSSGIFEATHIDAVKKELSKLTPLSNILPGSSCKRKQTIQFRI